MYEDVVSYIQVLKRDSPQAAAAIEEILAAWGARAALRATLVITLLKIDAEKNHSVKNLSPQMDLVKDFPVALPLLERAINFCLQAWRITYREAAPPENETVSIDGESTSSRLVPPSS